MTWISDFGMFVCISSDADTGVRVSRSPTSMSVGNLKLGRVSVVLVLDTSASRAPQMPDGELDSIRLLIILTASVLVVKLSGANAVLTNASA